MNINVIYKSRSGNSEKIARVIADEALVMPINIDNPHTLKDTDLLFVGTGIYQGKPDRVLLDYIDSLPANKIKGAAVFSTSVTGNNNVQLLINHLKSKNIQVYDKVFSCKGSLLFLSKGHPNNKDLLEAREFARSVLSAINID